jgi:hypothetical protein
VLHGKRDSASAGGGLGASAPNFTVRASVLPKQRKVSLRLLSRWKAGT